MPNSLRSENASPFNLALRILEEKSTARLLNISNSSSLERWSKAIFHSYVNEIHPDDIGAHLRTHGVTKLFDAFHGELPMSKTGIIKRFKKRKRDEFISKQELFLERWKTI